MTRRMATESIEAAITGDDITTGFNPQFLLDGLSALEAAGRRAGVHPDRAKPAVTLGRGLASTARPTPTSATC